MKKSRNKSDKATRVHTYIHTTPRQTDTLKIKDKRKVEKRRRE